MKTVLLLVLSLLCLTGCTRHAPPTNDAPVVIAIEGDADSFNPLFAEEIIAGEINDLLFPALVGSAFDTARGVLVYTPLLATRWERRDANRDIVFHLRGDAQWSDGVPVTARDVRFSYELYGDPDVASVRQSAVEGLRQKNGAPDVAGSVDVQDDTTVVFHFERSYPGQLFDAGLPIIPMHLLAGIPRKDLRTSEWNRRPVGSGPFLLSSWAPLQEITLVPNVSSVLPAPALVSLLRFRIIPEYRSRVAQLRSGEVDIVSGLRAEDLPALQNAGDIRVSVTPGRDYDFLGWNNIDPASFKSTPKKPRPHPLFGDPAVRRALTMAINRKNIIAAYLGGYGHEAVGPVSPLFRWAYNDTLTPLPCDPAEASRLLARAGWRDTDGDGVIDRNGRRFSFSMKVPSGNQMRATLATVVQQALHDIGIDMSIDIVERGTFWEDVPQRKYDAFFAGFSVPLQMQFDDLWGSDLERYPFNLCGFRNARVDAILDDARQLVREEDGAALWKEFQEILQREQPCTFLYWIDTMTGIRTRVQGVESGVLGLTHGAWLWRVDPGGQARPE